MKAPEDYVLKMKPFTYSVGETDDGGTLTAIAKLVYGDPGYTSQPDSAVDPGKGAVPINPFLASGPGRTRAIPIADDVNWRIK